MKTRPSKELTIGVLALQGAVREHIRMLERCGVKAREIKVVSQLEGIDGLIIPGGESTTIGKLIVKYGFVEPIKRLAESGIPIYGTCAGLILIGESVTRGEQPLLNLMDITVERNAFGRQTESFETDLKIGTLGGGPFKGVFIRAPLIEKTGQEVDVMADVSGKPVMARQRNLLVTAFHPELTDDTRIHDYFIGMVKEA